ncbi:putative lipoyltransferase 2, mitochondrial [Daphnia magna]|uniref:lipoyl(octanoyl) transferase n=1 Tax=Daphnia magna TaxID=35525 RepID=A0ABR0A9Q9_9CRUS|nr:putative lipoyltransferase 2, mitochondrial [Daphnia magna]KAK4021870.1 hypothetical protein OUZ56_007359 [Daphnia magna]
MKIPPPSQNFHRSVSVWFVGFLQYQTAYRIQKYLANLHGMANSLNEGQSNDGTILIVEHAPVYTTGIRTSNDVESEGKKLKALGAEFYRTNRGGLTTFHGPGQLVVYPVLNLKNFNKSMKWYICKLEETIIQLCKSFGVEAGRSSNTGVWVKNEKLCAIGVHGSRYITTHGLALNVNNDLTWFSHIVPCGIPDKGVTSLSQVSGKQLTIANVINPFLESFSHEFECQIKMLPFKVREDIVNHLKKERLISSATEEQLLKNKAFISKQYS